MSALSNDWLFPPPAGWQLADVQGLPENCRVEVIDGALIVHPSPLPLHQRVVRRLAAQLEGQLPAEWQLETDVDVMLNEDPLDYLTPDVVVFSADVALTTRPIRAPSVLLVVEVVSKGSRREDRGSKPLAYAEAGIPHFWRVEGQLTGALTTELHAFSAPTPDSRYDTTESHTGSVDLRTPFFARLDLDALH